MISICFTGLKSAADKACGHEYSTAYSSDRAELYQWDTELPYGINVSVKHAAQTQRKTGNDKNLLQGI